MSIEIKVISKEQTEKLLNISESHFCDLKGKEILPSKLTRTLSAFANADGGDIYIGINEIDKNKEIREQKGFSNIEEANSHIRVCTELFPQDKYSSYEFLENEYGEGLILHITIHKTKHITKATDGRIYKRQSAQNIPVITTEEIKRLELEKGITTFESQTLGLSKEIIITSEVTNKFITEIVPSSTPETWLKKQLLISEELPTVAGVLLFSDEPQAALPKQSGVKIYRYATQEKEGRRENLVSDPITVEGSTYNQIYDSIKETIKLVEEITVINNNGSFENIKYPPEAIHEIITNAILHRDYSISKDVHIRVFDNRIEIESPGRLPGHISVQNILTEQFARNGAIVRIINKFPKAPNKDIGEGLNTAFNSLRKLKLKDPDIINEENSVRVVIKHESLGSPESIVMEYLKGEQSGGTISNSEARKITGIESENTMKHTFKSLQAKGLIDLDPTKGGGSSRWYLKSSGIKEEQKKLFE